MILEEDIRKEIAANSKITPEIAKNYQKILLKVLDFALSGLIPLLQFDILIAISKNDESTIVKTAAT